MVAIIVVEWHVEVSVAALPEVFRLFTPLSLLFLMAPPFLPTVNMLSPMCQETLKMAVAAVLTDKK